MKYLLIVLLILSSNQEKKHDISLKLEEGQTYYHTIRTESDFLMMMNEEEMLMTTIYEANIRFDAIETSDSGYTLQVQYEKLSLINESPFATMEFSSDSKDSTNMMSGFLKAMVGKPFTVMMNKHGEITDIQNIDTLYSGMWNGKAGELLSSNENLSKTIDEQMGAGVLTENYSLFSAFYPGTQVADGESWSNSSILGKRLMGSTVNTFSLMSASEEGFIIEGSSQTYTKDEEASMEVMGKSVKYDLEGGMTFEGHVDKNTGWIIEASIQQDFKGKILMGAEEPWNERNTPVAVSSVITITNNQ